MKPKYRISLNSDYKMKTKKVNINAFSDFYSKMMKRANDKIIKIEELKHVIESREEEELTFTPNLISKYRFNRNSEIVLHKISIVSMG